MATDVDADRELPPALLAGRVVLVTGGDRGLDRDPTRGLADVDAAVAISLPRWLPDNRS